MAQLLESRYSVRQGNNATTRVPSKTTPMTSVRLLVAITAMMLTIEVGAHEASTPTSSKPSPTSVPTSLLDVMRAAVEIPADGIWEAQSAEKISDDAWLLVDQDSVALASAATLISLGGTGKKDRQWVSNRDWQTWARDVQKTALAIRVAGKARNADQLNQEADHLSEVCQACHTKYRPETPSDGVARYPFYPKRVLAK